METKLKTDIERYFNEHNLNYSLIDIFQKADDSNIYTIVARNKTSNLYAAWTCWNNAKQTLDYGHYMLERGEAYLVAIEYAYRPKEIKSFYQLSVEQETEISYDRMVELMTLFKDVAVGDRDLKEVTDDMTDLEKEFAGLDKEDDDDEY